MEKEIIEQVVNYLNEKLGTRYRPSSIKTVKFLTARIKEGFELNDFKKVIDKKVNDWEHDNKMSKYLRPETLFGNKFEGYLNELQVAPWEQRLAEFFDLEID